MTDRIKDVIAMKLDSTTGTFNPPGDLDLVPIETRFISAQFNVTDGSVEFIYGETLTIDVRGFRRRARAKRYKRISLSGPKLPFRFRHRAKRRGGR